MTIEVSTPKSSSALRRTPRANPDLPQKLGEFSTLTEGLDYAAKGITGFNFYSARGELEHVLPYADLRSCAIATARKLAALGLSRGSRVAVVAETGPEFITVFFACQYAGLVPCPMPYTMYIGGKEAYIERVAGMLRAAHARAAITSADLASYIVEAARRAEVGIVRTHEELQALAPSTEALVPFGSDDIAYIQYSSGSTSEPKGVLITQKAVVANTRSILADGMRITPADRAFSWLPLYHDMGLVGFCLSPVMGQVTVDYLSTPSFARRPALWLRLMSQNRSTLAYSPSFGYDLAARRINGEARTLDLSHWRVAGIGGDMVRADVLAHFAEVLSVAGFDRRAFLASYGMAETTLAISIGDVDKPIKIDSVDKIEMKYSRRAVPAQDGDAHNVRSFVVCGKPLPGTFVEIRDDDGRLLGDREVGRVFVKSPSLMSGYFRNEPATRAILGEDGFIDTGDMAYWLNGEIVITGRAKDLILHNGRNIWPQDIEWAAEHIEPLRDGDVAAFAIEGDDGEDDVVVLVQCRLTDQAEMEDLRRRVAAAVHQSAAVECEVVLVPPRSLPFTSSGKLSRAAAKQRFLSGEIAEINRAVPREEKRWLEAAQ
jgi:fatty-acyl-CoA synthase